MQQKFKFERTVIAGGSVKADIFDEHVNLISPNRLILIKVL